MLPICLRTGGSNECCFGIQMVHVNGGAHGMIGQANWWHTRASNNWVIGKCSHRIGRCGCSWVMILYSFVPLDDGLGLTLPAPQRGLPSDMQAQSQVKSKVCMSCPSIFFSSRVWKAVGCPLSAKNGFHPFNQCFRGYWCLYGSVRDNTPWTHLWSLPMGMQWSCHAFFKLKYASPMMKSICTWAPSKARWPVQLSARCVDQSLLKYKICFVKSNVSTLCLLHYFVPCQSVQHAARTSSHRNLSSQCKHWNLRPRSICPQPQRKPSPEGSAHHTFVPLHHPHPKLLENNN